MTRTYLSPAFSERSEEELQFLQRLDGSIGFPLFWVDIVKPLLCHVKAKSILEIGAYKGDHTLLLIEYCKSYDGHLTVIEPVVLPHLRDILLRYPETRLMKSKSQEALQKLDMPIDAVLLEGDLNYYTVYNDLCQIENLAQKQSMQLPLIFIKNSSWPYAKRDMYYDPESIPAGQRHPYSQLGMTPWAQGLEKGMINPQFSNAVKEGGPNNGVLVAVEDFIEKANTSLDLFSIPYNHGMDIIYMKKSPVESFIKNYLQPPPLFSRFIETIELQRLNDILWRLNQGENTVSIRKALHKKIVSLLQKIKCSCRRNN